MKPWFAPSPTHGVIQRLAGLLVVLLVTGCASVPGESTVRNDPWERTNRKIFAFNEAVDQAVIKPTAQAYQKVVPSLVRKGVSNVFGNLADGWTGVNLVLQAKTQQGLNMLMRTALNTTLGLAGVLDVAEEAGLERTAYEDLGQTLGVWGVKSGPYIVLPLLGPSTVRDAAGRVLDTKESGAGMLLSEPRERNTATFLQLLDVRVSLFAAERFLNEIALDKYVLVRDAYLARRRSLIYDGDPPEAD